MKTEMKIKLFDSTLPLPKYHTKHAVGLDLYARQTTVIQPNEVEKIPLNVAIELPEGYWGMMAPRSSIVKKGLMVANSFAVMDPDFCGDNDEYVIPMYNRTAQPVTVERGERIVQLVLIPAQQASISKVNNLTGPNRGGFGTTGAHELPTE